MHATMGFEIDGGPRMSESSRGVCARLCAGHSACWVSRRCPPQLRAAFTAEPIFDRRHPVDFILSRCVAGRRPLPPPTRCRSR